MLTFEFLVDSFSARCWQKSDRLLNFLYIRHKSFLSKKYTFQAKQKQQDKIFQHVARINEKLDYLFMKVWAITPSPASGIFDLLIKTSSGKVS